MTKALPTPEIREESLFFVFLTERNFGAAWLDFRNILKYETCVLHIGLNILQNIRYELFYEMHIDDT